MMLQDLSPSRVVAASAKHAGAVVVSTTHLPMAMAGPWTVCVPTRGRYRAHVVRCDATARAVWMRALGTDDAAGSECFQGGCSLSWAC